MKEIIEKIVNAWYQTYLNEQHLIDALSSADTEDIDVDNVSFDQDDFLQTLEDLLPQYVFKQVSDNEFIIVSEL